MTADTLITDPALHSVLTAATRAREQSLALLDFLAAQHHDTPADSELDAQLALSKQQKLLHAHLARLRGLNRHAILSVRATKHETAEARQEIDSLHLQLQNLYYEQRHLRGEIAGCEGYEHRFKHLPLIPFEDFLAQHPEQSTSSGHDLMLARMADERAARQQLEEERLGLVKRKEALVRETTAKKEELGRLDAEMEKWLAGQEGVRRVFEARGKRVAG
ncbi:hypothetical protein LTR53_015116 [Teratosphaeriaceae sp. CCFEE 6253]|nr:hypothetical protein LTR53_015116 [Teratosphaeriaceae sp. CCFEE 6253]